VLGVVGIPDGGEGVLIAICAADVLGRTAALPATQRGYVPPGSAVSTASTSMRCTQSSLSS
jgi:hypothetical protein